MILIDVILKNTGGELDRQQLGFDAKVRNMAGDSSSEISDAIKTVIGGWQLAAGDTIEILGNEEAFKS